MLPPCPICGKDDLFMGRDGKPGCPHCEVAVVLPVEPTVEHEHYWIDAPDDETAWYCPSCGVTEYPGETTDD